MPEPRQLIHVVRSGTEAPATGGDWVVRGLAGGGWALVSGEPLRATVSGAVDDDQLIQLIFAADLAIVW